MAEGTWGDGMWPCMRRNSTQLLKISLPTHQVPRPTSSSTRMHRPSDSLSEHIAIRIDIGQDCLQTRNMHPDVIYLS